MTDDPLTEAERAARKAKPIEINEAGSDEATGEELSANAVAHEAPDSAAVPVVALQEELKTTRAELQNTIEYLETANEGLNTVNSQLQHKIGELESTISDLNNLLAGSETAMLFLDDKFRIWWFAPATKDLFDLVSADIGRPIAHFAQKFSDQNLLRDAETVLKKLSIIDAEVLGDTGRWYVRRMLPYRTQQDNRIAGVVVTFMDITERKRSAEAINEARIYAEAIVATIRQSLLVLDGDLRVLSANPAFYTLFKVSERETEGQLVFELGNGQWDIPLLRTLLKEVMSKNRSVTDFEVEHDFGDIGRRCMMLNASPLSRTGDHEALILLAIEDISERRQNERVVRQSQQRLKDMIEALPGAIYTTDAAGLITSYNPAAIELWGRKPELGSDEWCGSWRMYRTDGTPLPHDECPMAIALRENRQLTGAEVVAERQDGVLVPFLAYPTPLHDASGAVTGAVNMLVDITERKRAEVLAERLSVIVECSEDAIVSKDLDSIITSWNEGAALLFGYSAEEVIGKPVTILIPPDQPDEEPGILARIRRGERIEHYETVRLRKDGSQVWVSLTVSPLKDAQGKIVGASKIARDMTERRRSDDHRKLLIDELNHRVKNTLAVVQSIASQSLGHASTMKEAREAFGSRLTNLAKAHDVLTRESWSGANLVDIVTDTIEPYSGGQNRFRVEGEHVRLKASAAVAIAMALHELATNAAKYGALTDKTGHVDIVWRLDGEGDNRRLKLFWTESGGPPVTKPTRKGFGSRMIERALAAELDGNVNLTYESAGVVCTIDAPMPSGQEAGGHGGR